MQEQVAADLAAACLLSGLLFKVYLSFSFSVIDKYNWVNKELN